MNLPKLQITLRKGKTSKKMELGKKLNNSMTFCVLWGLLLNFVIETLARKGLGGISFLIHSPEVFLFNALIITATLIIASVFKRRVFIITVVTIIWMAIGITNGIILTQRMTPFTVKDLSSITDGATILTNYFSIVQIVAMVVGITAVVVFLTIIFIKAPKKENVKRLRNLVAVICIFAMTFGSGAVLLKAGSLSTFFGNLAYAYEDYGVPYCFINTWLNTGIHKPSGYSKKKVCKIFDDEQYGEDGTMKLVQKDEDEEHPNILFLQLESFVDPSLFNKISLSEDAVPYFRQLMSEYSSGNLQVPACGAGTANTEFEVMTGISVKFFGPGEYPFKSILKNQTAESIAFDLKSLGYSTHAIHNHRALFYNRNQVFANIGYDSFTSLEYMSDVAKTPKNWAKDQILVSQIMDALTLTEERDYIYTISVQGHGKYPTEELLANPKIKVMDAPSEELRTKYEYYVNQLYEMDQFIKSLTDTLSNYDEDVVLVLYGDHIPALDVTEDAYDAKNLYTTQYVVWSNFPMEKKDEDLYAYQLAAEVFDRLDIHTGTTIKYHQTADKTSSTYLKKLRLLAYDITYGKHYVYGGTNPFEPVDMTMGVKPITIDEVVNVDDKYFIKGNNFTEYSKVTLNGKTLDTIYLSPKVLGLLESVEPEAAKEMKVSQIDKSNQEIISTTE